MRDKVQGLAASIADRGCVLFVGAGLTADSGGAIWGELIESLKMNFGYSSPLKDNFRIIGDLYLKFGKESVYNFVKKNLMDAKISESRDPLTKLSWFAVFTTNYDLVPFHRKLTRFSKSFTVLSL